jgi:hypothetical protein
MSFSMKAEESGDLVLSWTDDNNETVTETVAISVES